jgi:shikimate kinase
MTAPARHLVLVGLMGAGKTTVGQACAQRLERDFVDTDDVVTALAGMPAPEVFATGGEAQFRALERQAVADVFASPVALVVACGGGTVVDPDNRRRVQEGGFVVWLRAPATVLARRVGDGADRPLLRGDPRGTLDRLLVTRRAAYEAVSDVAIDTEERSVEEVTGAVLDAYCGVSP